MNRTILWIGGVVVLLAIIGGGVYTAVQLLSAPEAEQTNSAVARRMQSIKIGNDGVPVSVSTTILPAPELPQERSAAAGIVLARQDDTLTVGTGDIELSVDVQVNGETGQEQSSVVPSTNGPELEVVLTNQTLFYRDVTDIVGQQPSESGEITITQELRPVADGMEIDTNMEIQVWGEKRGDRVVAKVVVFGPLAGGAFE